MKDWHLWYEGYADPSSALSRRLLVVTRLVAGFLESLSSEHRVISLCAGDGRDVIPVMAARPAERRPELILVELDAELAASARQRAREAGVRAVVEVGDAGLAETFRHYLPADLLMLCGIFGNVSDDDIKRTVEATTSMVTQDGAVIWTRGAFRQRDIRDQIRQWFATAGFDEIAFEAEPGGYGVGANRATSGVTKQPLPERLFAFNL